MDAWNIDADTIELGQIKGSDLNNHMVMTKEIENFLDTNTRKMFIVAPKGLGKTYLLKVKSQLYRDNSKGYKFIPEGILCERFNEVKDTFSKEDVVKFNNIKIWQQTWELCLYSLILKTFEPQLLPEAIREIIGDELNSLATILSNFLFQRENIDRIYKSEIGKLISRVEGLNKNSNVNQIAIFVDNIDEAFDEFVGVNRLSISEEIWINAQLSLLLVSMDVCKNNHVKIYLTIRSEAYNRYEGAMKMQLDDRCIFLKYTKDQIKEIFIKNVKLMVKSDLLKPKSTDPIEAFLGRKTIPHKFVISDNGKPQEELVFDFIYRHTYQRPREIVEMGKHLASLELSRRSQSEALGSKVNEVSYKLFAQLRREIIPVFRDDLFEAFCLYVNSTVISYEESVKIAHKIKSEVDPDIDVFRYFFKIGLLGISESEINDSGGYIKQSFLDVGQYTLSNINMPKAKYFITHPSINKRLKDMHGVSVYEPFNIIGYDLPLNMRRSQMLESHVHFGMDRETLTTFLPEVADVKSIALIIPPSPEWHMLENVKTFTLIPNSRDNEISFKVYNESQNETEKVSILRGWAEKKCSILIYSDNINVIQGCLEKAQAISVCYLTPAIKTILTSLVPRIPFNQEPYFYLCYREFTHNEFNQTKEYFFNLNNNLKYQPVILDRFQFNQELILDKINKILICEVSSETYGTLICFDKPNATLKSSKKVRRVQSNIEFDFFSNRHNYLVEGLFQLFKLLNHDELLNQPGTDKIIDEFLNIQIKRTVEGFDEHDIRSNFHGKSRRDLEDELRVFSSHVKSRIFNLSNVMPIITNVKERTISSNKSKGYFPSDEEIYQLIRLSPDFFNKEAEIHYLKLLDLLMAKPLTNHRSIFISYSTLDLVVAELVFNRLLLQGFEVTMYSKESIDGSLRKFESRGVKENDKMIFIASQHSLKSDPCHGELKKCFEMMRRNNDVNKLIVLGIDDYIFRVDPYDDIIDEDRQQNYQKILKHTNVSDFRRYLGDVNYRQIDQRLAEMIRNVLIKPSNL